MEVACTLCRASLQDSSSRRTISPKNAANESIRNFFLEKICPPEYKFTEGVTYYLCRVKCYRQVEKATKLHQDLQSLLAELRCQAQKNCSAYSEDESTLMVKL